MSNTAFQTFTQENIPSPFFVLEQLAFNHQDRKNTLSAWCIALKKKQDYAYKLNILQHTVLVYALRTPGLLSPGADSELIERVRVLLSASWFELTGREHEDLLKRLPRSILREQDHETRLFHAAVFQNLAPEYASDEVALGKDFIGDPADLLIVAVLLTVCMSSFGRQALAGLALGYTIATLLEFGFHGLLAHPPQAVNQFVEKLGENAEREFNELKYSHAVIHHSKTFKARYNVQFSNADEKLEVERLALARGPQAAKDLLESRFGDSLSPRGVFKGLKIGLPLALIAIAGVHGAAVLLGLHPSAVFDVSALLLSMLNLPATGVFHAYMHMSRKDINANTGPVMRWLLNSRYTALMSRLHYGHHRGRGGNFNLLFGADALFGTLRKPTIKQLLEMRKQNLIY